MNLGVECVRGRTVDERRGPTQVPTDEGVEGEDGGGSGSLITVKDGPSPDLSPRPSRPQSVYEGVQVSTQPRDPQTLPEMSEKLIGSRTPSYCNLSFRFGIPTNFLSRTFLRKRAINFFSGI